MLKTLSTMQFLHLVGKLGPRRNDSVVSEDGETGIVSLWVALPGEQEELHVDIDPSGRLSATLYRDNLGPRNPS